MRILIFTIVILSSSLVARSQHRATPRAYYQNHFEDSAHVHFTYYPNPFSGVKPTDFTKVQDNYSSRTFYCDLADSVTVALKDKNDSTVYSVILKSSKPPFFRICFWVAGSQFDKALLPSRYYVSSTDTTLDLILLVGNRQELSTTYRFGKDLYYWIDEYEIRKH